MGRSILLVSAFVLFSFASGPFMQPIYYSDQMQRSLDSWKMEKNNREEVQFQTLRKAPTGGMTKKERTFCREHVAVLMMNFPPLGNAIERKM